LTALGTRRWGTECSRLGAADWTVVLRCVFVTRHCGCVQQQWLNAICARAPAGRVCYNKSTNVTAPTLGTYWHCQQPLRSHITPSSLPTAVKAAMAVSNWAWSWAARGGWAKGNDKHEHNKQRQCEGKQLCAAGDQPPPKPPSKAQHPCPILTITLGRTHPARPAHLLTAARVSAPCP
jgi:hypothetical protein